METPKLYTLNDLPMQTLMNGQFARTALRSDGSIVTVNWFEPNASCPEPHIHPFDQLSLVITGTLVFLIDGRRVLAGPGTALRIPSNVPHTAHPIGNERVLNIDVFAPIRQDYLFLAANKAEFPGIHAPETKGFGV